MDGNKRQLILTFAAAAFLAVIPFGLFGELPGRQWLSSFEDHPLAFGIAGSVLLSLDIWLAVPSSVIISLLAVNSGVLVGFLWGLLGLTLGNIVGYLAALFFANRFTTEADNTLSSAMPKPLQIPLITSSIAIVLLSRPIPIVAEAVTLTAGATGMQFRRFLIASMVGNCFYVGLFSFVASKVSPDLWSTPLLIILLAYVAAAAIINLLNKTQAAS